MSEKGFEQKKLGFAKGVKIDVDDVVAAGHSLGGATALVVGESDKRVKAVVTMDPWLIPLKEMIEQKKFTNLSKKPTLSVKSEYFDTCHHINIDIAALS